MSRIVESLYGKYGLNEKVKNEDFDGTIKDCDKKLEEDMSSAEMFRDAAEFIDKWCDFIGDKDQFLDIMSNAWDEKM